MTAACTLAASAFFFSRDFCNSAHPSLTTTTHPLRYLFDYTNATANGLADFIVNDFILGPNGLGNANLSGFYLDVR